MNNYLIRKDERKAMNYQILNRHFPEIPLKPNINVRPVSTKYTLFPIVDGRINSTDKKNYLEHYTETNFAPIESSGPVNLSSNHINTSSELKGLNVPLHKGDLPMQYVPSLNSDMYVVNVPKGKPVTQPFPGLFTKQTYKTSSQQHILSQDIGKDLLNNNTRVQLRTL